MNQASEPAGPAPGDRLSTSVMLRYGVGMTGAQMFRDIPAALLPVFMTTVLGIEAWVAGLVILLPKAWVIFCDPLMGAWSDRRAPTTGRTPFLVAGAISTCVGFLALFTLTNIEPPLAAAAAVSLLFLLSMTGFSGFSVPYLAIAATLTRNPHERTKLLVYRLVFTSVGVILGVGLAQPTVYWLGGGQRGWSAMAAIFAGVCLVSMLGSAIGLRPVLRQRPTPASAPQSLKRQFLAAWRNRPFRQLTVIHFIQTLATACQYTVIGMVFIYLVDGIELMPLYIFAMATCGIVMQPVWFRLSRRIGKISLFVWQCAAWCAVTVSWLAIDWGANTQVALPMLGVTTLKDILIVVRGGLIGMANVGFILIVTSLFTDTVYLGEDGHGTTMEGSFAGLWSAIEKLAFALGPVVAGTILSLSGYRASKEGPVTQDPQALFGILANYSIVPFAFFVVSLLLVPRFARSVSAAEARRGALSM
ncbi:hypothetical protein B2G71_17750 [Novosphingobium sp. PC22D]|uniref:MFS transporter n=1 Tax=Novosphingobium sp. PC22D TaxID=1962403 RepID=UPI000BFADB92|nr:MFS transporter [Novosphingobium sp. PC22D]PEQ11396.1 hypothetical protein B2G71_17750 [Novosphingobium sp. PC22D]